MISFGESNLIVEGISNQIILAGLSRKFSENGLPYLDLDKMSIVPAMGATGAEAIANISNCRKSKSGFAIR